MHTTVRVMMVTEDLPAKPAGPSYPRVAHGKCKKPVAKMKLYINDVLSNKHSKSGYSHICRAKGAVWDVLIPCQASPVDKVGKAISVQLVVEIHILWNLGYAVQMLVC